MKKARTGYETPSPTGYPELYWRKDGERLWRLYVKPDSMESTAPFAFTAVGPWFHSKAELLRELDDFARNFGFLEAKERLKEAAVWRKKFAAQGVDYIAMGEMPAEEVLYWAGCYERHGFHKCIEAMRVMFGEGPRVNAPLVATKPGRRKKPTPPVPPHGSYSGAAL